MSSFLTISNLSLSPRRAFGALSLLALLGGTEALPVSAAAPRCFLETIRKRKNLTSTVPGNGDVNPYAVVVAPVAAGKIAKGDVLVSNFNNVSNLQGTGTTIVQYNPTTKATTLFAKIPQKLLECPGGVGLSTAMTMLKSGWVIVGSTPSTDGTTATLGKGGLIVLDPNGKLVAAWTGPDINGPWGNMAVVDRGDSATLFISMAGFDVPSPKVLDPQTGFPVVLHKATVLRVEVTIPEGQPPVLKSQTVVADGFSHRADKANFLLGPTGLGLGSDGTLFVTNGLDNVITAIPDALTRTTSAGTGRIVSQGGLLSWPLALAITPSGHLLVCNGKDGRVVEIDPIAGKQLCAQWLNSNQAQTPPGNGNLFGIAMTLDGEGFYYVQDDTNTLTHADK